MMSTHALSTQHTDAWGLANRSHTDDHTPSRDTQAPGTQAMIVLRLYCRTVGATLPLSELKLAMASAHCEAPIGQSAHHSQTVGSSDS